MGKQRHGKVAKHGIVPVCLKGHTLSSTPPWQREWTTVVHSEILIESLRMQEDRKRTQPDKEVRYHEGQQESEVAVASAGGETLSKAHVGGISSRISRGSVHRGLDSVSSVEQLTLS